MSVPVAHRAAHDYCLSPDDADGDAIEMLLRLRSPTTSDQGSNVDAPQVLQALATAASVAAVADSAHSRSDKESVRNFVEEGDDTATGDELSGHEDSAAALMLFAGCADAFDADVDHSVNSAGSSAAAVAHAFLEMAANASYEESGNFEGVDRNGSEATKLDKTLTATSQVRQDALSLVAAAALAVASAGLVGADPLIVSKREWRRSSTAYSGTGMRTPKFLQEHSAEKKNHATDPENTIMSNSQISLFGSPDLSKGTQKIEDQATAPAFSSTRQVTASSPPENKRGIVSFQSHHSSLHRPYSCPIENCKKSYTRRRGLLAHGKIAHPQIFEDLKAIKSGLQIDTAERSSDNDAEYDDYESDFDEFQRVSGSRKRKRKVSPSKSPVAIQISGVDGQVTSVTEPAKRKRTRRLSASDFVPRAEDGSLLSTKAAEILSARIAFLNEHKPFACSHKGCKKRYRNVNGLKYHLEKGHIGSTSDDSGASTRNASTSSLIHNTNKMHLSGWSSSQSVNGQISTPLLHEPLETPAFAHTGEVDTEVSGADEEGEVIGADDDAPVSQGTYNERPFECPHLGCGKSYKNKNGLLYHLRKGKLAAHGVKNTMEQE
ncbi:hypothetical protein HDU84_001740 [Entophlyctis sp. JEL0112]|nr:hypothetical protein HDU84_001740 [Entophlyctis sp. JEL0112]